MNMRNKIIQNKPLYKFLKFVYKFTPYIHYIGYPLLLFYLVIIWDLRFIKVFTIPLFTFLAVTVMRILINRLRPYEKTNIKPLFPKKTKRKSFPSRHVASSVIITFSFLYINVWLGAASLLVTITIAVLRPIAGIHYPSDVLGAAFISSLFGLLFFIL